MTRRQAASAARLLAWVAAGAVLVAWDKSLERPASAVMAVPAREAESLCSRTGHSLEDFWKRLRAAGVSVALLPEERLSDLVADGRVLGFSRAEWEKWGAMGLLAPGVKMRPGTAWIRDRAVLLRVAASARASGASFSTSSAGGFFFVEFPEGFDWPALPAGLASDAAKALSAAGLIPALDGAGAAGQGRVLLPVGACARRVLAAVHAPSGERRTSRAFGDLAPWGQAGRDRLIVWKLAPGLGVDGNISALRETVKPLRLRGWSFGPAADAGRPDASWEWPAKLLFGLIVLMGPLLAVRSALAALKAAAPAVRRAAPLGSPVFELAAGLTACWCVAALAGVGARIAAHYAGGSLSVPWRVWTLAGPVTLGAMSLFPFPWPNLTRSLDAPLTAWALLKGCLLAAAVLVCLDAKTDPAAWALAKAGDFVFGRGETWWWLPWRWREAGLGWPGLMAALFLVEKGWSRPASACDSSALGLIDPRPWLLAGLLGPAGVILCFSNLGLPFSSAAAHSLGALALGSLFGGLLHAARQTLFRRAESVVQ